VMIRRLEVEADEMASFVQKKANKQWVWIAMDAKTRHVIAFHVGDRSRRSAKRLWAKIPLAYRQHATFYTDQYVVYAGVIPAAQHRAISKLARKTNHLERFNNTLRQRVSRLVREALSFSKKLVNHAGAIKLFICHYNLMKNSSITWIALPVFSNQQRLPNVLSQSLGAWSEILVAKNNVQETRADMSKLNRPHESWVQSDVLGLFLDNVRSFSMIVGLRVIIFSWNVGRKWRCSRAG
jgi:insertion element IS1 protein InsB